MARALSSSAQAARIQLPVTWNLESRVLENGMHGLMRGGRLTVLGQLGLSLHGLLPTLPAPRPALIHADLRRTTKQRRKARFLCSHALVPPSKIRPPRVIPQKSSKKLTPNPHCSHPISFGESPKIFRVVMACKRQTFGLIRACRAWVGVAEWAPGGFLALTRRVWEQGPALAQTSSLSCGNKCFFEVQPAGIAQRFAQARRKVSW